MSTAPTRDLPADLDPQRIAGLLRTARYGRSLRVLRVTDSTNDDARQDALGDAPDGHVVIADSQRAGRGSHGRVWTSPVGSDLYLSIVARPASMLAALPPLTLATGLGVAESVEHVLARDAAVHVQVKWPNDVWLNGKKCAGILVEASMTGTRLGPVVIGIGLNINRMEWADALQPIATSLRALQPGHTPIDRGVVLCALLQSVETWIDRFVADTSGVIAAALDARLALRDTRVRCAGVEGILLGVAPSGALRIATASGIRELIAGRLEPCP